MEPTSLVLLALLVAAFVGLALLVARVRLVAVQGVAALAAFAVAALFGVAAVNRYYSYYTSWSALGRDLTNAPAEGSTRLPAQAFGPGGGQVAVPPSRAGHGELLHVELPGAASGISRSGYVYLPPAYFDPVDAHRRFPVLELVHGSPGRPADWLDPMKVTQVMDSEVARGRMQPLVLVMPDAGLNEPSQECVDAVRGPRDDTYLGRDVPGDVARHLRVQPPGHGWAIAGFSTGGFCSANLALHHPEVFAASVVMDGYFHPLTGRFTGGDIYRGVQAARLANDPTWQLLHHHGRHLPAFYLMVGTGDRQDLADAVTFHEILSRYQHAPFVELRGARHIFPAWERELPSELAWVSRRLAPPVHYAPGPVRRV